MANWGKRTRDDATLLRDTRRGFAAAGLFVAGTLLLCDGAAEARELAGTWGRFALIAAPFLAPTLFRLWKAAGEKEVTPSKS